VGGAVGRNAKPGTFAWLAGHVADLPHRATITLTLDSLDFAAPEMQERPPLYGPSADEGQM
jgi:hypothetical protein